MKYFDDYKNIEKRISTLRESRKAKLSFKQQAVDSRAKAAVDKDRLENDRDSLLREKLVEAKNKEINACRTNYLTEKMRIENELVMNKASADKKLLEVSTDDIAKTIYSKLAETSALAAMRTEMDEVFKAVLGEGLIKVLNVRIKEANIADMTVKELIDCIDQYGTILTKIKKYSPFKVLSLKRVFSVIFFDPAALGVADESTAWLWYLYIILLFVGAYFFNFVLVIPITFLLCYVGISNTIRYYRLYNLYIPYIQLKSSLDNLDSAVQTVLDKFAKKRANDIKVESNRVTDLLLEQLKENDASLEVNERNVHNNFDEDKHARRISESFVGQIEKCASTIISRGKQIQDYEEQVKKLEAEIIQAETEKRELQKTIENYFDNIPKSAEKILKMEYFFGFNGGDMSTVDFKERAGLIFYRAGDGVEEHKKVVKFALDIVDQSAAMMDTRALKITYIDNKYGGADLAVFGGMPIYKAKTAVQDINKEMDEIYEEFQRRRDIISSSFKTIAEYNKNQIANDSEIMPYHIYLVYEADPKLYEEQKFQQMIRNSYEMGIIFIVFFDLDIFSKADTTHKPQMAINLVELFNSEVLSNSLFKVSEGKDKDGCRLLIRQSVAEIKEKFRES